MVGRLLARYMYSTYIVSSPPASSQVATLIVSSPPPRFYLQLHPHLYLHLLPRLPLLLGPL